GKTTSGLSASSLKRECSRLIQRSSAWTGRTNLTASVIGNFAGFSDWRIATRASREGPGEGGDKTSADGCDRVRHMPFGADRRRLGVGSRREGQIPRRAGCKAVLRGEGRRVRRSGSRRRRYRVWRGGESRATHALRNRQSRAPA